MSLTEWAVYVMDYYQIGQRIRKVRKAKGLSQEALAAKVDISLPHMSHIETGNTKLSLPVLVALAEALDVKVDDLLYDNTQYSPNAAVNEIAAVLLSCTAQESKIIVDMVKALKAALEQHS
jgi:transcriptional regulator with XRE-family HTH domain